MSGSPHDTAQTSALPPSAPAGHLPLGIGTVLFALGAGGAITITTAIGYPVWLPLAAIALGTLAGLGVKYGAHDVLTVRIGSIMLLWIAPLGIAGLVGVATLGYGLRAIALTLFLYAIGYGFVGATTTAFGHGHGSNVFPTVISGAMYLLTITGVWIGVQFLPLDMVTTTLTSMVGTLSTALTTGESLVPMMAGVMVLLFAVVTTTYLGRYVPLEPLLGIDHLDDISSIKAGLQYVRYLLFIVLPLLLILAIASKTLPGLQIPGLTNGLRAIVTNALVLQVSGALIVTAVIGLFLTGIFNRLLDADTEATLLRIVPATTLALVALIGLQAPGVAPRNYIPDAIYAIPFAQRIVASALTPALLFATAAIMITMVGGMLLIPTLLPNIGNSTFTGLLTATVGLLGAGVLGGMTGHPLLALATIGLAVFIWDVGEYSMTASAELAAHTHTPTGFRRLTALRVVTSVGILAVAIGTVGLLYRLPLPSIQRPAVAAAATAVAAVGLALFYTGVRT